MKKLRERSLYRPGSDCFLPAERFIIDPVQLWLNQIFAIKQTLHSVPGRIKTRNKHQFAFHLLVSLFQGT